MDSDLQIHSRFPQASFYLSKPLNEVDPAFRKMALSDPAWRIQWLYYVLDKEGEKALFKPWPEQIKFINNLWYRNVIPKARQRGFSTVVQLMALDNCLFNDNFAAAIIAQDIPTAVRIMRKKLRFAYDNLPPTIRKYRKLTKSSETEMIWNNNSSIYCAPSARGDTLQFLHVSELGKIAKEAPGKADEIQTGALPAVDKSGIVVVESTVESPDDAFSEMVKKAKAAAEIGRPLTQLEYRLHFASWWDADEYELDPANIVIEPKMRAYFERMEAEIGAPLSPRKRAWYVAKLESDFSGETDKMHSQYPTTLTEALQGSMEGKWFAHQLARVRARGGIMDLPWRPDIPVDTYWDIGVGDDIVIWFAQEVGPWTHWIDYYEVNNAPYSIPVIEMLKKPYVYGRHFLPHDADHRIPGAEHLKTTKDILEGLKLRSIEVVPRIANEIDGINQTREDFASYRFDRTNCKPGISHLENFAKTWSSTRGHYIDVVYDNGHQHAADAIRQRSQVKHIYQPGVTQRRPRRGQRTRGGMGR